MGFCGEWGCYTDVETGLVLMGYRYYNPFTCRFITRDPAGYEGGINLYAYCGDNPVANFDPMGTNGGGNPYHPSNRPSTGSSYLIFDKSCFTLDAGQSLRFFEGELKGFANFAMDNSIISPIASIASSISGKSMSFGAHSEDESDGEAFGYDLSLAGSFFGGGGGTADSTRVGRWMSEGEHSAMVSSGRVQESISGTTHVAHPADPGAFMKQAKPGSVYVEFDVPASSVKRTQAGWGKIVGPNSLEGRLAARKGLSAPQMPRASNIVHMATKLR